MAGLLSPLVPDHAAAQPAEPLQVVTTFSILGDIVANVGGDAIALESIVPAGGDAHTFDPTPDQVAGVSDADLIFEIGIGFEPWLADMVEASGTSAQEIVVTDGLDLIDGEGEEEHAGEATPEAGGHEDEAEGEEHEHEHEDGAVDPHVWGDVANVIAITATVKDALVAADPANAATYEANATAYTTQLQELDQWIRAEIAKLPEDRHKLVTSHDTFGYFARAYGFEVVGTAIGSVSTESGDPSAQDIAALVEQIEATGVPAIFTENVSNPDLIDAIASEAGVTVGPALYTDALGEPGSEGDTYIKLMTYNVTSIVTALSA
jgi:ABC-type Zn uptake system ZnuABC Zn-binding protein ZnuA